MIQDYVFLVGGLGFIFGLVPSLTERTTRIPIMTSLPTGITLLVFGACQFSLGLPLGGIANLITGVMWLLIAKYRRA